MPLLCEFAAILAADEKRGGRTTMKRVHALRRHALEVAVIASTSVAVENQPDTPIMRASAAELCSGFKGSRTRKRCKDNCTPSVGTRVVSVSVGRYTPVVCRRRN